MSSASCGGDDHQGPPGNLKKAHGEEELKKLRSEIPQCHIAVIYIYSNYCPYCTTTGPVIKRSARLNPTVNFIRCNALVCLETVRNEFKIRSTPAVVIVRDGKKKAVVKRPFLSGIKKAIKKYQPVDSTSITNVSSDPPNTPGVDQKPNSNAKSRRSKSVSKTRPKSSRGISRSRSRHRRTSNSQKSTSGRRKNTSGYRKSTSGRQRSTSGRSRSNSGHTKCSTSKQKSTPGDRKKKARGNVKHSDSCISISSSGQNQKLCRDQISISIRLNRIGPRKRRLGARRRPARKSQKGCRSGAVSGRSKRRQRTGANRGVNKSKGRSRSAKSRSRSARSRSRSVRSRSRCSRSRSRSVVSRSRSARSKRRGRSGKVVPCSRVRQARRGRARRTAGSRNKRVKSSRSCRQGKKKTGVNRKYKPNGSIKS